MAYDWQLPRKKDAHIETITPGTVVIERGLPNGRFIVLNRAALLRVCSVLEAQPKLMALVPLDDQAGTVPGDVITRVDAGQFTDVEGGEL